MRRMLDEKDIKELSSQLYKHVLDDNNLDYHFILINHRKEPYDFSEATYTGFRNQLIEDGIVNFYEKSNFARISYSEESSDWISFSMDNNGDPVVYEFDDWDIQATTDTVSKY